METLKRPDSIKKSGIMLGAAALAGVPRNTKATKTDTTVSIVKSKDPSLPESIKINLDQTAVHTSEQMKKGIERSHIDWTKESEAEIERRVRKAVRLAGGLPVKPGHCVSLRPNLILPPHVGMLFMGQGLTTAWSTVCTPSARRNLPRISPMISVRSRQWVRLPLDWGEAVTFYL